jgi:hypothetical protein
MRAGAPQRAGTARAVAALVLAGTAAAASATPAQGYSLSMTPVAHQGTRWLLVHVLERSDPNTTTASGRLPSMAREGAWWLLVDGDGRPQCRLAVRTVSPADAGGVPVAERPLLLSRLRANCRPAVPAKVRWIEAVPAARLRWSPQEVCTEARCMASSAPQYSLGGVRSAAVAGAGAAAARCVAGRWLLVTNLDDTGGSDSVEGARFPGLPPALRPDIIGHETVRIDGIARAPAALGCD